MVTSDDNEPRIDGRQARTLVAVMLQAIGLVALVVAAWFTDARLGLAVLGVAAVVVGLALDTETVTEAADRELLNRAKRATKGDGR